MPSGKRRFAMRPGGGLVVAGAGLYDRHDRGGFMPCAEIFGYFERYVAAVLAPARVGVQDLRVEPTGEGGFRLHLLSQATREDRK